MAAVATETFTSTCAPIQYAAIRAFEGGPEIDDYLQNSRRVLRALGTLLTRRLQEAGATIAPPQGGFYLFPDFSRFRKKLAVKGIQTSTQLCERLLNDTGVAFLPGIAFGRDSEELTARIAYVDFDGRKALSAVSECPPDQPLNDDFVHEHCGRVVEAMDRICNWLDAI